MDASISSSTRTTAVGRMEHKMLLTPEERSDLEEEARLERTVRAADAIFDEAYQTLSRIAREMDFPLVTRVVPNVGQSGRSNITTLRRAIDTEGDACHDQGPHLQSPRAG